MSAPNAPRKTKSLHSHRLLHSNKRLRKVLEVNPPSTLPTNLLPLPPPPIASPDLPIAEILDSHCTLLVRLLQHTAQTILSVESQVLGLLHLQTLDRILGFHRHGFPKNTSERDKAEYKELKKVTSEQEELAKKIEPYKEAWANVRMLADYVVEVIRLEVEYRRVEKEDAEERFWWTRGVGEGRYLRHVVTGWLEGEIAQLEGCKLPGQ